MPQPIARQQHGITFVEPDKPKGISSDGGGSVLLPPLSLSKNHSFQDAKTVVLSYIVEKSR